MASPTKAQQKEARRRFNKTLEILQRTLRKDAAIWEDIRKNPPKTPPYKKREPIQDLF